MMLPDSSSKPTPSRVKAKDSMVCASLSSSSISFGVDTSGMAGRSW